MITFSTEKCCYIDGIKAPILHEFNFLYSGWELDNYGYVVEYQGLPRLISSEHGKFRLVPNNSFNEAESDALAVDVELLTGYINDYKTAIEKTQKAIDLLTKEKKD
jgi:hypothetical protein